MKTDCAKSILYRDSGCEGRRTDRISEVEVQRLKSAISRIPSDVALPVLLGIVAASIGMIYLETWGGRPMFWQPIFGPGVMWACGHEYRNPALDQAPGFREFLFSERECFPCENIPADIDMAPPGPVFDPHYDWSPYFTSIHIAEFVPYQHFQIYLIGAAGLCWRLFGVCWSALHPLLAILYGVTAAVSYGLFRLGMRRRLAVVCVLLLAIAPLHLQQLPHYRDYAKAPFILGAILIMGVLAKIPLGRAARIALAGLGGAVIGLGLGFRPDVNIALPAFVIVTLLFAPEGPVHGLRTKALMLATFAAGYLALGWPILIALRTDSHMAHWATLGFMTFCDARLGVATPLYDFGGPFLDFYVQASFQSYAQRVHGCREHLSISTAVYDEVGRQYLWEMAKRFPADLALRAYAAVLRVLDEMQVTVRHPAPRGIEHPAIVAAYRARVLVLSSLVGSGRYYTGLALALVGGHSIRLALCALFILLYFTGYTAALFTQRHCFHLEFISLWVIGFLAQRGLDLVVALRRPEARQRLRAACSAPHRRVPAPLKRSLAFCAVAVAGIILPVAGLRAYQHRAVLSLLDKNASAPVESLPLDSVALDADRVRLSTPGMEALVPVPPEEDGLPVNTQCFVVEFTDQGRPEIPIVLRYESDDPEYDFTREDLVMPATANDGTQGDAIGRLFIPVFLVDDIYDGVHQRFLGLELAKEHTRYVRGLYRVSDLSSVRLLLRVALPSDWRDRPLHQGFTR
ncbi:MAG TPA: hypothetical protein PK468_20480 [Candidatus Hydrogenedentes bacterium]|nr:hypothetical protein [Candidatus Hydrogenedentota bacterium]